MYHVVYFYHIISYQVVERVLKNEKTTSITLAMRGNKVEELLPIYNEVTRDQVNSIVQNVRCIFLCQIFNRLQYL
jgi:hypothetical protein